MEIINPFVNIVLSIVFIIVVGIGLLLDVLFLVLYWEKLPGFFRSKKDGVNWVIGDIGRIMLFFVLMYMFLYLIQVAGYMFGFISENQLRYVSSFLTTWGIYFAGIIFIFNYFKRRYDQGVNVLGLEKKDWARKTWKGILIYIAFIPIMILLTALGLFLCKSLGIEPKPHEVVEIFMAEKSVLYIVYMSIVAVVIAPIFEEILFRGILYQFLRRKGNVVLAIVISSTIFSLLHCNSAQLLPILGLGMLFCFIFEVTGSLVASIVVHMINNGVFLGLFFILKRFMV